MQVHKIEDTIYYFSRSANEHGEQSGYKIFDEVVKQQVAVGTCVLDGELVVWNRSRYAVLAVFRAQTCHNRVSDAKPCCPAGAASKPSEG